MGGSRNLLKNFVRASSDWLRVIDSVCNELDVVVVEGDGFLGYGAFGRVFRVKRISEDGDVLALKIILGSAQELYIEEAYLRMAYESLPEHVMEPLRFISVEKGAGLLLAHVGERIAKDDCNMAIQAVEALAKLHDKTIFHGDARIANAVIVGNKVKWIDFREAGLVHVPDVFRDDMATLVCSLLRIDSLDKVPIIAEAVTRYPQVGADKEIIGELEKHLSKRKI